MFNCFGRRYDYRPIDLAHQPSGFGIRHVQALLLFFGLTVAYALRVNLSVAIVAMTDKKAANEDFEEFDWDEKTQSYVLSSFFWGYVITQIPAGQMAQRFGAKVLLLFSLGICSSLAVLTPICANVGGAKLVIGLRIIQGLSQGFIFPSTHTLLSKWAPVSERGRLGTYCYAGAQFGTVVMLAISGVLASSSTGWPGIFYISGAAGVVWSILWFFFGGNSPVEHRSISAEERDFIESSLGNQDHSKKIITPWKAILTSAPMIALTIAHSSHNWGFWTLLTEMPTYMKNVLDLDIKSNALLSSLPYFVMWILSLIFSPISDFLINRQYLSRVTSRKLFNTIGLWIPMVALLGLAYVPKGQTDLAIALLTAAVGINSATYLGFQVNHIDLAPNHAGTMMGITNCAANIMSIIAPLIVGVVLSDAKDPVQWRTVFYISAAVYFCGNLVFIILGKADIQPWNEPQPNKKDDDSEAAVPNNQPTNHTTE
ncbi:putative inorganic phosphate cotransporter isoform X2 [Uranotaenia lowii]|uniref:putative inorganic phosphate cotransporter isoform X2 n=1 Tax=Uranotaenia lowii TaxID=190385 RepID=UPI0024796EC5|nr:putative inorganic phosphate cotransporter isoform X2 [Uranotaenia lowii]XP_055599385.1 putative inorganic phosphate cotransporter isoform X2 [Uranotaenia lowii]